MTNLNRNFLLFCYNIFVPCPLLDDSQLRSNEMVDDGKELPTLIGNSLED